MSKPPLKFRLLAKLIGGDMPDVLLKLWAFFDGKKTAIAALLQLVADLLNIIIAALPAAAPAIGLEAATALAIVAKLGMVLGLLHKVIKYFGGR